MTPTTRVNLALVGALASLSALGACMTQETARLASTPYIVPQTFPYTPGTGTVQTVMRVPAELSAAAGTSAPATSHRLGIRMDNGTWQYIDADSSDFGVGSRVQLGPDRLIRPI
ncbi:MAG: hypothetical protein ACT4P4_15815 [Betaproteobacteria bacterium]